MNSVETSATTSSQDRSSLAAVVGLSILALAIRAVLALRGGLWRDEALFLSVTQLEPWNAMIDFLRFHESHPPLFYFLMRPWLRVLGSGDIVALALPVLIGAAIVPTIFLIGSSIFSRRVGLVAALLASFAPALSENSALVRPYSLLPLLSLLSIYWLIRGLEDGARRAWIGYVAATLALLYTHNWGLLILAGQWVAVLCVLTIRTPRPKRAIAAQWLLAQVLVGVAYLPWLPSLAFQTAHAGHPPVSLDGSSAIALFLLDGVRLLLQATIAPYSAVSENEFWTMIQPWLVVVSVALFFSSEVLSTRKNGSTPRSTALSPEVGTDRAAHALIVLVVAPLTAWAAALAFSMHSNLLIARCLVTLAPPLILATSYWIAQPQSGGPRMLNRVAIGAIVAAYMSSIYGINQTTRSNAKEIGTMMAAHIKPSDLVIVAPDWLASSFNRYFTSNVQQIDFPYFGRESAIDFNGFANRLADPAAFARLQSVVRYARAEGRRVWLVMEARDVHEITAVDLAEVSKTRDFNRAGLIRANQIRFELTAIYPPPDTSLAVSSRVTQFERFRVYLFEPPLASP